MYRSARYLAVVGIVAAALNGGLAHAGALEATIAASCRAGDRLNGKPTGYRLGLSRSEAIAVARSRQPRLFKNFYGFRLSYPQSAKDTPYIRSWDQLAAATPPLEGEEWSLRQGQILCPFYTRYAVLAFKGGVLTEVREKYEYNGP